ncbi:hypothetical protein H0H93_015382, partial [Arthromyces matolae]
IRAAKAATSALLRRLIAKHRLPHRSAAETFRNSTSTLESARISQDGSTQSSSLPSMTADDDGLVPPQPTYTQTSSSPFVAVDNTGLVSIQPSPLEPQSPTNDTAPTPQVLNSSADAEAKPSWLASLDRMGKNVPASHEVWRPVDYSTAVVPTLDPDDPLEEELLDEYIADRYYPVVSGDVFNSRYQVVQKMGFGATSTVWLARDLQERCHVALKIFINDPTVLVNTGAL